MRDRYIEIPGSFRDAPVGARLVDAVPEHERVEISLYLKDRDGADPTEALFRAMETDGGVAIATRPAM